MYFVAHLDHALGAAGYARALTERQAARVAALLERRIVERQPLPYLTRRAFFAGLELYVDEHVLVPRSPIAELILQRFSPWMNGPVRRILDLGTGSGAIALACAKAFPGALIDAIDISPAALRVCRRNVRALKLVSRVRVLRSDHFEAIPTRRYDIIVANPPYVGRAEMRRLPREYLYEPRLGLASGSDGLDSVRVILREADSHLQAGGILVVEVGNSERALLRAFPHLPFIWPDIAMGGGGVFILKKDDLSAAGVRQMKGARRGG